MSHDITPFELIRRTNPAGDEYWSCRDFARVLGYTDCRGSKLLPPSEILSPQTEAIFAEGELSEGATCQNYPHVRVGGSSHGSRSPNPRKA